MIPTQHILAGILVHVICMDPEGNLMKGGAWDGEQILFDQQL